MTGHLSIDPWQAAACRVTGAAQCLTEKRNGPLKDEKMLRRVE